MAALKTVTSILAASSAVITAAKAVVKFINIVAKM
jgi:hypothetical protein